MSKVAQEQSFAAVEVLHQWSSSFVRRYVITWNSWMLCHDLLAICEGSLNSVRHTEHSVIVDV